MSERRLRVVFVLDWFFYYAAGVANALADTCDVLFVTRDHGHEFGCLGNALTVKRKALDPRIDLVIVNGAQSDPRSAMSAARARRAVRDFDPDVVHVQAHSDWRLLYAAGGAGNTPGVLTVHDVVPHEGSHWTGHPVHRIVRGLLVSGSDGFIVHGDSLVTLLRETVNVGARPVFSIPHGLLCQQTAREALPLQPSVLFFGRVEYYKGLDVLVQAAAKVRAAIPDLKIIVAGRGPHLKPIMDSVGNDDTFEWIPRFIDDAEVPALFARASFVVLPYREASQSGVVPLAFASGRTVLATRVGSLAESVDDGVTGVLCDPDDADQLADAMVRLLADRAELERLSAAAAYEAEHGRLSARSISERHMEAYHAVMRERGRPR